LNHQWKSWREKFIRTKTYLSEGDDSLLGSHAAALQHDEVIVDLTVVGEATHGGDALLWQIVLSGGIVLHDLEAEKIQSWIIKSHWK
jgi:hypothetical protein